MTTVLCKTTLHPMRKPSIMVLTPKNPISPQKKKSLLHHLNSVEKSASDASRKKKFIVCLSSLANKYLMLAFSSRNQYALSFEKQQHFATN